MLFPIANTNLPTQREIRHMFLQASGQFSTNMMLLFYLFDFKRKVTVSRNIACKFKKDHSSMKVIGELFSQPDIKDIVKRHAEDPSSPEAQEFVARLLPIMRICGAKVAFGHSDSSRAYCQLRAMTRYFGTGAHYLTISPSILLQPLAYRYSEPILNNFGNHNDHVHYMTGYDFDYDVYQSNPQRRKERIAANPVAEALCFGRLISSVFTHLLKSEVAEPGTDQRKSPLPLRERSDKRPGVAGHVLGHFFCVEASPSSAVLHIHAQLCHQVDWLFLHKIADNPELNHKYGKWIDSIIATEFPTSGVGFLASVSDDESSDMVLLPPPIDAPPPTGAPTFTGEPPPPGAHLPAAALPSPGAPPPIGSGSSSSSSVALEARAGRCIDTTSGESTDVCAAVSFGEGVDADEHDTMDERTDASSVMSLGLDDDIGTIQESTVTSAESVEMSLEEVDGEFAQHVPVPSVEASLSERTDKRPEVLRHMRLRRPSIRKFRSDYCDLCIHVQDHKGHTASCFKGGRQICRYA